LTAHPPLLGSVARVIGAGLIVIALAFLVLLALAAHPALPERPAGPLEFDAGTVQRGAGLAAVGNCTRCHTAEFGAPYAGGVALAMPFRTIHGTNITPDPETGIGRWSEAAFVRAMRDGIDRAGKQLYPAFPYDHFTRITDGDLHALYAFMMTRDPVHAPNVANALRFPFAFRPIVAGWNLLFLKRGPQPSADARGADWNRGAYPRTGSAGDHATAGGPMQGVVASLARAPVDDVRAIATYVAACLAAATPQQQARAAAAHGRIARGALGSAPTPDPEQNDAALQLGRTVYAGACARCHDRGRDVSSNGALQLPRAIAIHDPDPRSLLRIVRDGIVPLPSRPGRFMPAFGTSLSDEQLVALLTFLRAHAADTPPWPELAARVRDSRSP